MSITGSCISTGHLPPVQRVQALVADAHARFKAVDDGKIADYIPALAAVPRDLLAVCVVERGGAMHEAGESAHLFSMQSVSKPFVFALVCEALGEEVARARRERQHQPDGQCRRHRRGQSGPRGHGRGEVAFHP